MGGRVLPNRRSSLGNDPVPQSILRWAQYYQSILDRSGVEQVVGEKKREGRGEKGKREEGRKERREGRRGMGST